MLQSREGQRVPNVTFRVREGNDWKDVTTDELFKGKNVVVFSLPGASPRHVRAPICRVTTNWLLHSSNTASMPSFAFRSTTPL